MKKRKYIQRLKHWLKWNLYGKWHFKWFDIKTIKGGCKYCGGDLVTSSVGFYCKNTNCNNALTSG
jgi:hypothetical protein